MKISNYLSANRSKLMKTFLCYISFLCFGLSYTLLGSSLFDLQLRMGVTFTQVSRLVPIRSFGLLIGTIISGFASTFLRPEMVLFLANLMCGLFTAIGPWFKEYKVVYACFFISGIALGTMEIDSNTFVLSIWNEKSANYVQILHGTFGIGSILAPLIVKPFLLPQILDSNNLTGQHNQAAELNITESGEPIIIGYTPDDVKVQYPFMVFGLIMIFNSCGFLYSYFKSNAIIKFRENDRGNDDHPKWKKILIIIIGAFICHASFAVNAMTGSLAPAFVVKSDLKMTKKDGANLVSTYWTVYTSYRLVFILLTNYIGKRSIIVFNCLLTLASSVLMFLYAAHSQTFAWVSFIMLAIGSAPTFAASLSFIQEYICITSNYASFIFLIGEIGDTIHPWIITGFMDKRPELFAPYVSCTAAVLASTVLLLPFVCEKLFKTKTKRELQ